MRIILILVSLFVLAGCETMDLTSVTVSTGTYHPVHHDHIRYTLGYYSGSYYNSYRVYGTHGHRYYYAPRGYRHHRHYTQPPVIVRHHHHHHQPKKHKRHDRRDDRRHDRRDHRQDHRRDHYRDDRRHRQ